MELITFFEQSSFREESLPVVARIAMMHVTQPTSPNLMSHIVYMETKAA